MATQASENFVQQLYVAYYGRPADQEGQQYWADRVDAEGESAIVNAFGSSAEYEAMAEGQGNATLVDNLYQQMFGRSADPEGLTYYTGVLESGEKSLAEIATTILNAASGVDRNDFNAKVEAAAEYTADFGSAEDYDDVAAKDVVENAEGGLYTPELTPAIEDYQGAQEAVSDYLQDTVASNEAVAENLEVKAGDADEPTDTEVQSALTAEITDAVAAVESSSDDIADDELSDNASVAAAQISAQQEAYADAVESAEATVAETEGLQGAINSLQSAETRYESALKAEVKTDAAQDAEFAKFASLNGLDASTFTINDDGTIEGTTPGDAVVEENNGELTIADASSDSEGVDALVSASQDQFDATQSVSKSLTAFETAVERVQNTESGKTDADAAVDTDYTIGADEDGDQAEVTLSVGGDAQDLIDAQDAVDNFGEAVSDYQELTGLQDQVDDLNDAVTEAGEAIEEQDVDLVVSGATDGPGVDDAAVEDDLFIFDADTYGGASLDFSTDGEDQLYIGDSYSAVELDLDSGDTLAGTDQGDANTLEVFFSDDGTDTTLSFEGKAFAGNNEGSDFDGSEVTLTGVTADQLSLDNGYIAVA